MASKAWKGIVYQWLGCRWLRCSRGCGKDKQWKVRFFHPGRHYDTVLVVLRSFFRHLSKYFCIHLEFRVFLKKLGDCEELYLGCWSSYGVKSNGTFQGLLYAYWLCRNPDLSLHMKWPIVRAGLSDARGKRGGKKKVLGSVMTCGYGCPFIPWDSLCLIS